MWFRSSYVLHVCMCFLQVLRFPPTVQRYAVRPIWQAKLPTRCECVCLMHIFVCLPCDLSRMFPVFHPVTAGVGSSTTAITSQCINRVTIPIPVTSVSYPILSYKWSWGKNALPHLLMDLNPKLIVLKRYNAFFRLFPLLHHNTPFQHRLVRVFMCFCLVSIWYSAKSGPGNTK